MVAMVPSASIHDRSGNREPPGADDGRSDPAASGAHYVSPTSGAEFFAPVREASKTVEIPTAGTYFLWALIEGLTDASDALYVGIDASFDRIFPFATGAYEWVCVETADASGAFGFGLAAGSHVIQVGHGEIGARLVRRLCGGPLYPVAVTIRRAERS
jgi:hypothetical protein